MAKRTGWSEAEKGDIRRELLAFFQKVRRPLPWRESGDPYAIWVSEVMSQQTRIETVVPYYRAWMERFPDLASLAEASQEEVLRAWQGLGYYSRARNLHSAARLVVREKGGRLPDTAAQLQELPGIGPYTAGAVASIAMGEAVPAVDGNVRRVLARLLDEPRPGAALLERVAGELVDPRAPGDFNQALMELGSLVCTPRSPDCGSCPLARHCLARARGTVERRPLPRKQRPIPHLVEAVAIVRRAPEGSWLMRRRPTDGLLGGMWEFPGVEIARDVSRDPPAEAIRSAILELLDSLPIPGPGARIGLEGGELLPGVDHTFSHRKVTYRGLLLEVAEAGAGEAVHPGVAGVGGTREGADEGGARAGDGDPLQWVEPGEVEARPLPVAQQALLERAREAALARGPGDP